MKVSINPNYNIEEHLCFDKMYVYYPPPITLEQQYSAEFGSHSAGPLLPGRGNSAPHRRSFLALPIKSSVPVSMLVTINQSFYSSKLKTY